MHRTRSGSGRRSPSIAALGLAAALLATPAAAQPPYITGETYWGTDRYVEYVAGNAALVISAAHGGYLKPDSIPDRTYGVFLRDSYTQEQARDVAREFREQTGRQPHLIISHLHRIKLDPNREIVEAAQGDPQAEQAWHEFHDYIDDAIAAVTTDYGRGHYIDVHGHAHPEDWSELGYALTAAQLGLTNAQLNNSTYINASTLRAIGSAPGISFPEILRGNTSLGGLLEASGYACVPSPLNPSPGGAAYFTGGYNVRTHSSRCCGTVDATQFELPFSIRGTPNERRDYADALAAALVTYFNTHYEIDPAANPRITVTATDAFAHETGDQGAFVITRTGPLANPLQVDFSISGRAEEGTDYAQIGMNAVIPANMATVAVPVAPIDDALAEGSESVTLTLLGGTEIGAPSSATLVIHDDENDPHLRAHWALDDAAGLTATDRSGNGHHGALQPPENPPQWIAGTHLGGLVFDEVNDQVLAQDFDYDTDGNFTLSFWFRAQPSQESAYQYVFGHALWGTPHSVNVYLSETTGVLLTKLVYQNDLVSENLLQTERNLMDGNWHLYTLVASTDALCSLYIDGELDVQAHLAGDSFDPPGGIHLGIRAGLSATRYFGGELDDVRLFDRALDPVEVEGLFQTTPGRFRSFGSSCSGTGGVPTLAGVGVPSLGNQVTFASTGGPVSTPAILAFGGSSNLWMGIPLPWSLAPIGAPGCTMATGPVLTVPAFSDPGGNTGVTLQVPHVASFIGQSLYAQLWLVDIPTNNLGLILTNGVDSHFGGL